jgi:4-hydroxy-3-methylbut-2-enyl diphosphate reductase
LLRNALCKLAYGNVLLALHGCGFAYVTMILAGSAVRPVPIVLAFLLVQAVYGCDKVLLFDPVADALNDPERSAFIRRWRPVMLAAAGASLLGGVALSIRAGWGVLAAFLVPFVVGVCYSAKVLPRSWRYRRLKDLPGAKSIVVAAAWGVGVSVLPLLYCGLADWRAGVYAVAWVVAREIINTAYFDLGDVAGDRAAGTRTLPVLLGFGPTRALLMAVNVASVVLLEVGVALGHLPPAAHAAALIAVYGHYYLWRAKDESVALGFLCDVVADSEALVAAAVVVAGLLATGGAPFG